MTIKLADWWHVLPRYADTTQRYELYSRCYSVSLNIFRQRVCVSLYAPRPSRQPARRGGTPKNGTLKAEVYNGCEAAGGGASGRLYKGCYPSHEYGQTLMTPRMGSCMRDERKYSVNRRKTWERAARPRKMRIDEGHGRTEEESEVLWKWETD